MRALRARAAGNFLALSLAFCCLVSPIRAGIPASATPLTAPPWQRITLNGKVIRSGDLRGKVVLLSFWATWCAPCLTEAPIFSQWETELGAKGLRVVGVAMDDDRAPVVAVAQRLHLVYPIVMGDAALARSFGGVLGLPVTVLMDRQGIVRGRFESADDLQPMHQAIETLLR